MENYLISGIQQVGIGVEKLETAWKHYIDIFNMDIRILQDNTVAELMLPYTGNQPQKRHAAIAVNMQGGGGFEIWQYSERKPEKIKFDINFGDLGVLVAKIKSRNVAESFAELSKKQNITILTDIKKGLDDKDTFYIKDCFGNIFQIIDEKYVFSDEGRLSGGPVGAIIGVRDIDKSLSVYRDILGYDEIIADKSGTFDDLSGINSGANKYRRVLLTHSQERKGSFSKLFGKSYIELVQALDREPRKIYENRFWGDPGFIHLCFDIKNMKALEEKCKSLGFTFVVDSAANNKDTFDMGEAAGHFTYIEDPDGNLIEFVETHKIGLIKSLGINLNLRNKNPEKSLPTWILKALKFSRVKPKELE